MKNLKKTKQRKITEKLMKRNRKIGKERKINKEREKP